MSEDARPNLGWLSGDRARHRLGGNVDEVNLGKCAREALEVDVVTGPGPEDAQPARTPATTLDESLGEARAMCGVEGPLFVERHIARP
jgi:hypothetical protein